MVDWLMDGMFGWFAQRVVTILSWLLGFLTSTFFSSPDVTTLPQVTALAARSTLVVNTGFVLAVLVAGILAMTHGSIQIRYAAKDLVPRLVAGFVLANFGVPVCHVAMGLDPGSWTRGVMVMPLGSS